MVYGERVRQAREISGLTQKALALKVGVTQSYIAQIERERINPSDHLLNLIAEQTNVTPEFFEHPPVTDFPLGSLMPRARKTVKAIERDRAYQFTKLYVEQIRIMIEHLELPELILPNATGDPINSARLARSAFGIAPDKPLYHLANVLEQRGVIIVVLPFALDKLDAFSTWVMLDRARPLIALSAGKPGDRQRFSLAHEFAHVLLHRELRDYGPLLEQEANDFAGELLLPEAAMRNMLSGPLTLTFAASIKVRWGLSIQAIVRRARDVGIISERRYRYLFEQINRLGWRKQEPTNLDIPIEKPRAFKRMTELAYGVLSEKEELAEASRITTNMSVSILEQYAHALYSPYPSETQEYTYLPGRESLS